MASDALKEQVAAVFLSKSSQEELQSFLVQKYEKEVFADLVEYLESRWVSGIGPEFAAEYPHVAVKIAENQEEYSRVFLYFAIFVGINVYDLATVTEFILKQAAEGVNPVMIPVGEIGEKWTTSQRVLASMAFYTQSEARLFSSTIICCSHRGLIDDHFTFSW